MSKKLPYGSGLHRAKRNRSRGPRPLVLRKATVLRPEIRDPKSQTP